jgi:hypothetical protein
LTRAIIGIRKNGSTIYNGCDFGATASNSQWQGVISLILYFNGTTDYVEMVGFMSGTGLVFAGGSVGDVSYLNGTLVRAA